MRDERTVTASPERIWALLSDLDHWPEMLPTVDAIERLGPSGPTTVGDRYRLDTSGLPRAVYTVTVWSPDREFVWVADSPGVRTTAYHRLEPIAGGTRMTSGIDWSGPLVGPTRLLLGRTVTQMVAQEATAFASLAEDPDGHTG